MQFLRRILARILIAGILTPLQILRFGYFIYQLVKKMQLPLCLTNKIRSGRSMLNLNQFYQNCRKLKRVLEHKAWNQQGTGITAYYCGRYLLFTALPDHRTDVRRIMLYPTSYIHIYTLGYIVSLTLTNKAGGGGSDSWHVLLGHVQKREEEDRRAFAFFYCCWGSNSVCNGEASPLFALVDLLENVSRPQSAQLSCPPPHRSARL